MDAVFIDGVPFSALCHHDGRFIRAPGLFAFARREPDGRYTILHFELTEAINRYAGVGHPRWGWALSQGMDTLLVHLASASASLAGAGDEVRAVLWHPDAEVRMGETEPQEDALGAGVVAEPTAPAGAVLARAGGS